MRIGFISTRFSGTDGVSLEAAKWAHVFENAGHDCFWFSGQTDRPAEASMVTPEAHFAHPKVLWITDQVFGRNKRKAVATACIHQIRELLKTRLHLFINRYRIDLLVVENALSIPMNIPLGLALTECIAETGIPTIAHHHDFAWERERYTINAVGEYLQMAFPPSLPSITHVVINTEARTALAHRRGIAAHVIPNVLDFTTPPRANRSVQEVRTANGFTAEDVIVLQPTRIIQRKGIEHAIDLVRQLNDERVKLVVTHAGGDEGFGYARWLEQRALDQGVDLRFVNAPVCSPWNPRLTDGQGFSLWDLYSIADFVTFPSLAEGFGNAFLEAVYFRKPILINRYATFLRDIEPLGFDLVVMDGYVTGDTVASVRALLSAPRRIREMTRCNYGLAAVHFSYEVLAGRLEAVIKNLFGDHAALDAEAGGPKGKVVAFKTVPPRNRVAL